MKQTALTVREQAYADSCEWVAVLTNPTLDGLLFDPVVEQPISGVPIARFKILCLADL